MNATAPVFAGLALLLAGPAPALLSRATWTYRTPRAAVVLWQAIALAAVLSAFGSGLAIAAELLVPGSDGRPTTSPTREIDALGLPLWLAYVFVFMLTLLVGARLIYAIVRVGVHTRRRRARHRMLVDLLDQSGPHRRAADIRVLAATEPIAYCLPGLRQRVVISEGTLTNLDDAEITAIVSHERSHLRARHDLVLEAFTAVHEAFPRVVRSKAALGSVKLLIELLADDSAVKVTGPNRWPAPWSPVPSRPPRRRARRGRTHHAHPHPAAHRPDRGRACGQRRLPRFRGHSGRADPGRRGTLAGRIESAVPRLNS